MGVFDFVAPAERPVHSESHLAPQAYHSAGQDGRGFNVCFLGATFNTANMGVSALTAGAIIALVKQFPDAEVTLLDYGRKPVASLSYKTSSLVVPVRLVNMRFSWKVWLRNNILILLASALLIRVSRSNQVRRAILRRIPCLAAIAKAHVVCSVAGGDSFSDIYGLGRFFYVSLPQLLVLLMDRPLCLMPQTLGPFRSFISRFIAKYIMNRAVAVYSRDLQGMQETRTLLKDVSSSKVNFCYDVGFVLEPRSPLDPEIDSTLSRSASPVVGVNVSGLLLEQRNNEFGLSIDYRNLVYRIIQLLIEQKRAQVVLVPHVFGEAPHGESDAVACEQIHAALKTRYPRNLAILRRRYDESEIKGVIGSTDFFIGSRMHACIAALSQHIPGVAIAYSNKFVGVMETLGLENIVADGRTMSIEQVLMLIDRVYEERRAVRQQLERKIPEVRGAVLSLFRQIHERVQGARMQALSPSRDTNLAAC